MADRDGDAKIPGRLARTLAAARLGAGVSVGYVGGKLRDLWRSPEAREAAERRRHTQAAERVVATLKELRGPLMKVGQLLSTHLEALPVEVGDILRALQQSAPPMPYETIARVIEADLGGTPDALFATFSREAVAAASLGQVHRATLADGTEVAVKVQYPGAERAVQSDLANVDLAAALVKRLVADVAGNQNLDVVPIAEEIHELVGQEVDYCREAYHAKLLGSLFAGDPRVLVPRVHDAQSGLRTITYDWIEGRSLDDALADPDVAMREQVVRNLVHAFWTQFFRGGLLHADPHAGNYRVLADGRLGLLDYGCVKIFDEPFLQAFGDMVVGRMQGDRARAIDAMVRLALIDDASDEREIDDIERLAGYFSVGLADDVFDFSADGYVEAGKQLQQHFLARRRLPPPRRNFLFLTRVVLGLYEYLARSKLTLPLRDIVSPYVEHGWTGRRIVIPPYDG